MVALGTGERGVVSRRQIIRSCKARGWTVQPDALNAIENSSLLLTGVVGDAGVDDDDDDDVTTTTGDRWSTVLEGLARHIQTHHPHSHFRTVTEQVWNEFAQIQQQQQQQQQGETKGRTKNPTPTAEAVHVEVINAFDTPKLVFEVMRKQFQVVCRNNNGNKWSLFGTAEDKVL